MIIIIVYCMYSNNNLLLNTIQQPEIQADVPAPARRSSRLKTKSTPAPKSAIPAPTKGARGRPTLGSVRNEQQDLVHQTRTNTKRNKRKETH